MKINRVLELSVTLSTLRFRKILENAYALEAGSNDECIDRSWADKGMKIFYRDSQYKKRIRVVFDLQRLACGCNEADRLVHKMAKLTKQGFGERLKLKAFALTGLMLVTNIDVGTSENVEGYLTVLRRIGKVKGFTPVAAGNAPGSQTLLVWHGNSNDTDLSLYDLHEYNSLDYPVEHDAPRRALRVVIRLLSSQAIRKYTKGCSCTKEQVAAVCERSEDIFGDVFVQVIPYGDYLKKSAAVKRICTEIGDPRLRRKMLRLLELVPEKRSLLLAQKEAGYRDMKRVMDAFAEVNLSPVTIDKRQHVSRLENIYNR